MVDVAKLNVQLFDLNGEYNDLLRQLGQVMYDTHRGEAPENDVVTKLLAQADEKAARIAELKNRIADFKLENAGGFAPKGADLKQAATCPACGEPCGRGDKFCRACGKPLS